MKLADALAGGHLKRADIGIVEWPARPLWRIYAKVFGPLGFNGTNKGDARFSPIKHAGAIIPTMYAATGVQAALMETVLHDVPLPSIGFVLRLNTFTEQRRVAQLHTAIPLQLADLSTVGLRRMGFARADVVDSDKLHYPVTRQLAAWVYTQCPDVHGLAWTSRQDDSAQAVVLFETRLPAGALGVVHQDQEFTNGPHYAALVELLGRLGASILMVRLATGEPL